MFKRGVCLLLALSLMLLSTGCATIVHGNRQLVTVNSNPKGASVEIDGLKGQTPYSVTLARNKDYLVNIYKEGYKAQQAQVNRHFSTLSIFGNILWLLVGVIVDFASGSAYNLRPTHIDANLQSEYAEDTDNFDNTAATAGTWDNKASYAGYYRAIREKIVQNISQGYNYAGEGTVSLNFVVYSDGRLKDVIIDPDTSADNKYLASMAIGAINESAPFGAFPEGLTDYRELKFHLTLSFKKNK